MFTAESTGGLTVLLMILWSGTGLLGTILIFAKGEKTPVKNTALALFSLPHAIVFGPFYLLMALTMRAEKECPYCKSYIPADATVCGKCTRDIKP